jgi:hypothetical protein
MTVQQGGRAVTVVGVTAAGLTRTQLPVLIGTRLLDLRLAAGAEGSAGAVAVTALEWEALGGDVGAQEALLRARLAHPVPPRMPPPPSPLSAAAAAAAHPAQQRQEQQAVARGSSSGGSIGGAPSPAPQAGPSAEERQERREQLERASREAAEALRPLPSPGQAQPSPQAVGPRRPASRPRSSAPLASGDAQQARL